MGGATMRHRATPPHAKHHSRSPAPHREVHQQGKVWNKDELDGGPGMGGLSAWDTNRVLMTLIGILAVMGLVAGIALMIMFVGPAFESSANTGIPFSTLRHLATQALATRLASDAQAGTAPIETARLLGLSSIQSPPSGEAVGGSEEGGSS